MISLDKYDDLVGLVVELSSRGHALQTLAEVPDVEGVAAPRYHGHKPAVSEGIQRVGFGFGRMPEDAGRRVSLLEQGAARLEEALFYVIDARWRDVLSIDDLIVSSRLGDIQSDLVESDPGFPTFFIQAGDQHALPSNAECQALDVHVWRYLALLWLYGSWAQHVLIVLLQF